jgi:hypothetical protein
MQEKNTESEEAPCTEIFLSVDESARISKEFLEGALEEDTGESQSQVSPVQFPSLLRPR